MAFKDNSSFCAKAFSGLSITPSGACAPCCLFEKMIAKPDGQIYKIWEDDVDQIYNSKFMQDVRSQMLRGEKIDACKQCYQAETNGGYSLRKQANDTEIDSDLKLDAYSKQTPAYLDLKLNNKCNLKCRMCQPRDSQLIYNEFKKIRQKDSGFGLFSNANLNDPDIHIPLEEIPDWSNSESFFSIFRKLLPSIKKISVVGGEPLLLDEVYKLIDICVEEGFASKIFLVFTSNLMHVPYDKISANFHKFKKVLFNISLDATDEHLYYIRFPSVFSKIDKHFKELYELRSKGNVAFQFTPTIQVYNILYVDKVYRYVEKLLKEKFEFTSTPVHITYLEFPAQLNYRILPADLKLTAAAKLKELLFDLPLLMSFKTVKQNLIQLIQSLEQDLNSNDQYISEFLFYSQILDSERGQNGKISLPELFSFLENYKPTSPQEPYYMTRERGWALAAQGKLNEAIKVFEESILISPNRDMDLREMAWMHDSLGNPAKALSLFQEAYKINPKDPVILKGLTLQLMKCNDTNSTKTLIKDALSLNPGDKDLLKVEMLLETDK